MAFVLKRTIFTALAVPCCADADKTQILMLFFVEINAIGDMLDLNLRVFPTSRLDFPGNITFLAI